MHHADWSRSSTQFGLYGILKALPLTVCFCYEATWQVLGASSCMGFGCHTPSSVPMHADILQSCSGQLCQSFDWLMLGHTHCYSYAEHMDVLWTSTLSICHLDVWRLPDSCPWFDFCFGSSCRAPWPSAVHHSGLWVAVASSESRNPSDDAPLTRLLVLMFATNGGVQWGPAVYTVN